MSLRNNELIEINEERLLMAVGTGSVQAVVQRRKNAFRPDLGLRANRQLPGQYGD